jgi:hypothetical protein
VAAIPAGLHKIIEKVATQLAHPCPAVFQGLKHWTVEDWEGIVWSDECSVEKSDTGYSLWVYRTPQERWTKNYVAPKRKGKGVSLMVRGCLWGPNRGPLVPIVGGTLNSSRYLELLKE